MKKLLFLLWVAGSLVSVSQLSESQTASQYPLADKLADRVIQKYETASCEQLKEKKQQPPDAQKQAMEQRVIEQLKKNQEIRKHFIDRIAAPIANKMFECGMIP